MVLADMWWIFLLSFGILGMSEKNYKIFGSVLGTLNLSNFFGSPGAFPFVYIRIFFYLFLIKPFLLFFFGLNLILNQFMIIYDSCVHAPPTTSDVFFQVRGMALFSLLLVCCCCCWFFFFLLSIWVTAQSKLILWFMGLIDLYLLCQNCCFWVQ